MRLEKLWKRSMAVVLSLTLGLTFGTLLIPKNVRAVNETPVTIVIDPGHGGVDSGASIKDGEVKEKKLNLKIAKYLKKDLEGYDKVTVHLTREGDQAMSLGQRILYADSKDADYVISIHNNSSADPSEAPYSNGSTVIAGTGNDYSKYAKQGQKLAVNILRELSSLGLTDQGILTRTSQDNTRYPNGELADYYAIVKGSAEKGMTGIIIEHAFLDNEDDYDQYLSSDDKLKGLAKADATGIARYLQKKDKITGNVPVLLSNVKENVLLMVDEDKDHIKKTSKVFYKEDSAEEKTEEAAADTAAPAEKYTVYKKPTIPEYHTMAEGAETESAEEESTQTAAEAETTGAKKAETTEAKEAETTETAEEKEQEESEKQGYPGVLAVMMIVIALMLVAYAIYRIRRPGEHGRR